MKYTILGCITKYGVNDIRPYVESINQSGFDGDKLMLCYDIPKETIDYLDDNGWLIVQGQLQEHIILQRFRDVYALLHQYDTDIVIWTDVKDVIFQKNPIEWIDKNMKKDILALSESLIFKNESWAVVNAGTSFPMEWDWLMNEEICCAGTIVAKKEALRDLFIDIYRWSLTTANKQQLADQAAYNILIRLYQYKNIVQIVKQQEGFAAQLHLKFKFENKHLCIENLPSVKDGYIFNDRGELYTIVHQYDRNESLKKTIIDRYI